MATFDLLRGEVELHGIDYGGDGPPVLLLHGLAGSSAELVPTANALADRFRVLVLDQRGHGGSTRRPAGVSRGAFVDDVVAVVSGLVPEQKVRLVGQSMGAHTAFLVAANRPDLVHSLVMLEGHAGGGPEGEAAKLGEFFASWPLPFADKEAARDFLGESPITDAWVADLEAGPDGFRPRFDADVMHDVIAAVLVPRWAEWAGLTVPTLAVFAENGQFSAKERSELIRRRPSTRRHDIAGASHDAHLDSFDEWITALREFLEE